MLNNQQPSENKTIASIENKPVLDWINTDELLNMKIEDRKDLIKNLFQQQSFNFIAGEEGSGKSLLAMNLACCIATAQPKFLDYDVQKGGNVLYLNNELPLVDFARRLQSMYKILPVGSSPGKIYIPKSTPSIDECWVELKRGCDDLKPALIILDCLYFAHNMDESDNSKMKSLMRKLLSLRDEYNLALTVIHHTKKGTKEKAMHNDNMRGAGVFGAASDSVLMIKRDYTDKSKRLIEPTKLRHCSDDVRISHRLSLNNDTLWFKDEGPVVGYERLEIKGKEEKIDFKVVFGEDLELESDEIRQRVEKLGIKCSSKTVDRYRDTAVVEGLLIKTGYGKYAISVK
jgi:energy-coupling factor transporter ATP-binding protein EcfA2